MANLAVTSGILRPKLLFAPDFCFKIFFQKKRGIFFEQKIQQNASDCMKKHVEYFENNEFFIETKTKRTCKAYVS